MVVGAVVNLANPRRAPRHEPMDEAA